METFSSWYIKNFWEYREIVDVYLFYDFPLVFTIKDEWGTTFFMYLISEDLDCEYFLSKYNYEDDLKKLLNKEIDIHDFLTQNLEDNCYCVWKINKFTGEMNEYYIPKAILSEKEYIPEKGVYLL